MKLLNRAADRMLAWFVPGVTAEAACTRDTMYCYCSGGIAYKRVCQKCPDGAGGYYWVCNPCGPAGTC
ncbi:hypothetical protein [Micromonospora zamorensis]|uniref:hypothetical protein n=1 Tax=Micromonospora zamorensis TaxID=709883 RepID=UPI0037B8CC0D